MFLLDKTIKDKSVRMWKLHKKTPKKTHAQHTFVLFSLQTIVRILSVIFKQCNRRPSPHVSGQTLESARNLEWNSLIHTGSMFWSYQP